ncbi:prolyl-tRNA synthetase associated domain-containing protein [Antarcticimicrobium luteum]|uniref:Prolyl-tRNA synthetase associated domain-containing protein n=1 Tax=Antarcticimicrobium luteum TaxID=2547397 RepID=A0A4V3ARI9_9RHOB|nr:prolyl-tRNA synthetase associated domain-containing protein [Antarcticimicrobium luteum]TDK46777.1 prolyl-tRNA synthetase associated domain-containing protein [Antarcticimicrobium luteum]
MDASSAYQDSLPVSSDALLRQLDDWGVEYRLYEHVPLRTVEDSKAIESGLLPEGLDVLRIKNLYLRDRKKRNYLVTLEQDRAIDLKALARDLGAGGLSFGSPERLMEFLGIRPGAVSPLAMVTGAGMGVQLVLDRAVQRARIICLHPLVNDRTVAMRREALMEVLERFGAAITWLD